MEEYRKELMERYGERLLEKYERSRHPITTKKMDEDLEAVEKISEKESESGDSEHLSDSRMSDKSRNKDMSLIMGIFSLVGLVVLFLLYLL